MTTTTTSGSVLASFCRVFQDNNANLFANNDGYTIWSDSARRKSWFGLSQSEAGHRRWVRLKTTQYTYFWSTIEKPIVYATCY